MQLLLNIMSKLYCLFKWILKKMGFKVTPYNKYKHETETVEMQFPEINSACIKEYTEGAKFYWSHTRPNENYDKYFTLDTYEHIKTKYKLKNGMLLWINRTNVKK